MADQKLTALGAEATPTDDDIMYLVDDPGGAGIGPTSKKIPLSTLFNPLPGTLTLANAGLHLLDTNASHDLIVSPGSDLTADRTLILTLGDANVTVELVEIVVWEELDSKSGAAASYDFQNISQDYTDLKIVARLRADGAFSHDFVDLALNNDAADANYRYQEAQFIAAGVAAGSGDNRYIARTTGTTATAGYFADNEISIHRYSEAEIHYASSRISERWAAVGEMIELWAVQWETANAITRITLTPQGGDSFVAGSEAILYGLRKRSMLVAT